MHTCRLSQSDPKSSNQESIVLEPITFQKKTLYPIQFSPLSKEDLERSKRTEQTFLNTIPVEQDDISQSYSTQYNFSNNSPRGSMSCDTFNRMHDTPPSPKRQIPEHPCCNLAKIHFPKPIQQWGELGKSEKPQILSKSSPITIMVTSTSEEETHSTPNSYGSSRSEDSKMLSESLSDTELSNTQSESPVGTPKKTAQVSLGIISSSSIVAESANAQMMVIGPDGESRVRPNAMRKLFGDTQ